MSRDEDFKTLLKGGLTNTEVGDLRDIMGEEAPEVKVTYCSSISCSHNRSSRKGRPISVGSHLAECPRCHGIEHLFHETVDGYKAANLRIA